MRKPSEYIDGEPQWNCYPFVRRQGDELVLGAQGEGLYTINRAEALAFADALVAAACWPQR